MSELIKMDFNASKAVRRLRRKRILRKILEPESVMIIIMVVSLMGIIGVLMFLKTNQ